MQVAWNAAMQGAQMGKRIGIVASIAVGLRIAGRSQMGSTLLHPWREERHHLGTLQRTLCLKFFQWCHDRRRSAIADPARRAHTIGEADAIH